MKSKLFGCRAKTVGVPRRGYTLTELAVSMAASSILLAGMGSTIYIANRAFDGSDIPRQKNQAGEVLADIMADVRYATGFSERTATAITFNVPDRDGDSLPETIRYAWGGTPGDPLTYEYNGSLAINLAEDVQHFSFTALTRLMLAPPPLEEPSPSVLFVSTGLVVMGPGGEPMTFSSPLDDAKISLIQSWGYTVVPIDSWATQSELDAAVADADVIYISAEVDDISLGTKLVSAAKGVVMEERKLGAEFGIADGADTLAVTDLEIADNTHYITADFGLGALPIYSSSLDSNYPISPLAPDLAPLAKIGTNNLCLLTVPQGGSLLEGGTAAGRRVLLPWGNDGFDSTALTSNGQTIMRRSIEWAAGAGEDPGPSEGILGYDTQFASTFSPGNAVQVGTQATLPEDGTLTSITAYINPGGGTKNYRYAIYSDNAGEPGNLIVESPVVGGGSTGWISISVTPTPLTAGTYWLALCFSHGTQKYYYEDGTGNTRHKLHNAVGNGFISVWPGSTTPYTHKVSIYGTYTPTP